MITQIDIDYLYDPNSSTKHGLICLYYYYDTLLNSVDLEVNI